MEVVLHHLVFAASLRRPVMEDQYLKISHTSHPPLDLWDLLVNSRYAR